MIHIWVLVLIYSSGSEMLSQEFYREDECLSAKSVTADRYSGNGSMYGVCIKKTVPLNNDQMYFVCNDVDGTDYFESLEDWSQQCKYIVR